MSSARALDDDPTTHPGPHPDSRLRLELDGSEMAPQVPRALRFRILDAHGAPATDFDTVHERPIHLIVVSFDVTTYLHLHPTHDGNGNWTAQLGPLDSGRYRVFADVTPAGNPGVVLDADLVVAGEPTLHPLPAPAPVVTVDGFDIALTTQAGSHGLDIVLTVVHSGSVVEPEPYLGARGHLVGIGLEDLSYVHVHPVHDNRADGVSFVVATPPPGRYRLFFDFSIDGTVRTAAFTVDFAESGQDREPVGPVLHLH